MYTVSLSVLARGFPSGISLRYNTEAEIALENGLQGVDGVELGGAAIGDSIALADVEAVLVGMLAEDV
jgi:hypothetical protein